MDVTAAVGTAEAPETGAIRRAKMGTWPVVKANGRALGFLAIFAILGLMGGPIGAGFMLLLGLVILLGMGYGKVIYLKAAARIVPVAQAEALRVMRQFAGTEFLKIDVAETWVGPQCSGTGIGWDGRLLYVLEEGEVAAIPLHLVRDWSCTVEAAEVVEAIGHVQTQARFDIDQPPRGAPVRMLMSHRQELD